MRTRVTLRAASPASRVRALAPTPCVLGLLAASLLGCPARLPQGATALDDVAVSGTAVVDEDDLLGVIASHPTSKVLGLTRLWWVEYGIYDPVTLEKDLQRIERYYQARGFYEARVRAGRVLREDDKVRVQIIVEEGPQVRLLRVLVHGANELPEDIRKKVSAAWKLALGDPFDEDLYRRGGDAMQEALTDNGYAYAAVKLAADVDLVKHEAVVHSEVVPGVRCTFGAVTIVGLDQLSEKSVRKLLMIEPGDEYSTKLMREAQNALFDLGSFDTVNFEPELSDPTRTVVPVKVAVSESKLRRVKVGPGFLIDPLRNDLHITGRWEHRNFFGGLRKFFVELRPMLIFRPGFFSVQSIRPGILTAVELRQPSFIEARTSGVIGGNAGILPDPVNDYQTLGALGTLGVDRRFWSILYAGLFYRKAIQIAQPYGGLSKETLPPNAFDATLGYFELLATLDARDDLLKPTRGYFTALSLQYATPAPVFGGIFADFRLQPEIRMYGPLAKGLTLAFRFTTGFLLPTNYDVREPRPNTNPNDPSRYQHEIRTREQRFDTTGATPAWRAFFSGGATGNRGYPTRYVGLRDCQVDETLQQKELGRDCSVVTGGASMWEASMELRYDISGPFSGVLFIDGSDVSRRRFDIRLDFPHLSAGPGFRYLTPVGPFRLDFGYRLPGLQRIGGPLDPREVAPEFSLGFKGPFALHLSIGEAF